MSRARTLVLLTLMASYAQSMVSGPLPPPPPPEQRAAITQLARSQRLTCQNDPDRFFMDMTVPQPSYPASRIKSEETAWKTRVESVVAEGWRDKYSLLKVERLNTYHRYQYLQVSNNGSDTERYYVVHTFHLKNGQVVKSVDARCAVKASR